MQILAQGKVGPTRVRLSMCNKMAFPYALLSAHIYNIHPKIVLVILL